MATQIERDAELRLATIASGGSLSNAFTLGRKVLLSIGLPAAWTAAAITFSGSLDGTTFADVYDDQGNELTIASANVVAGRVLVDGGTLMKLAGIYALKLRSGTSASPVVQGAARAFTVNTKG